MPVAAWPGTRSEYIDPIAASWRTPSTRTYGRRVIEPDSLPNLVTNLDDPECAAASPTGDYVRTRYALDKLAASPNVYTTSNRHTPAGSAGTTIESRPDDSAARW